MVMGVMGSPLCSSNPCMSARVIQRCQPVDAVCSIAVGSIDRNISIHPTYCTIYHTCYTVYSITAGAMLRGNAHARS